MRDHRRASTMHERSSAVGAIVSFVSRSMIRMGQEWGNKTYEGPWGVKGNTFDTVQKILRKWA